MAMSKRIAQVLESVWQSEGRGAMVRRSIGRPELTNLDPFLMLDEFSQKPGETAGFPDHPHRGFETVTYMLDGKVDHEDFMGHKGTIGPGDLQWMTAGRGIVHCEMPVRVSGAIRGLQLWVNLAKEFKMTEPVYQEHAKDQIISAEKDGVTVKVIAGQSMGLESKVRTRTPTYYLDFNIKPGASFSQPIPKGWTTFAYTLDGTVKFSSGSEDREIAAHHTVVFDKDSGTEVTFSCAAGKEDAHFVLIAGQPIGETVAQRGPFVMNSQEELIQAMKDYREGANGFERAPTWKSDFLKREQGLA